MYPLARGVPQIPSTITWKLVSVVTCTNGRRLLGSRDCSPPITVHLGLAEVPAGAVAVAESPDRGHHQLVTPATSVTPLSTAAHDIKSRCSRVDGPGPDGEGAEVGAASVHDWLVHVVPAQYCVSI